MPHLVRTVGHVRVPDNDVHLVLSGELGGVATHAALADHQLPGGEVGDYSVHFFLFNV